MAFNDNLSKDEQIKSETLRLERIFKNLDPNKRSIVKQLIQNAAFMAVTLAGLQKEINTNGYREEYHNGANQYCWKQTDAVKTYLSMVKNLSVVIKQLADLAPPAEKKKGKLIELLMDQQEQNA